MTEGLHQRIFPGKTWKTAEISVRRVENQGRGSNFAGEFLRLDLVDELI